MSFHQQKLDCLITYFTEKDCCGYMSLPLNGTKGDVTHAVYRACFFKSLPFKLEPFTQTYHMTSTLVLTLVQALVSQKCPLSVHNKHILCFRLKLFQVADQTKQEVRHRNGTEYLGQFSEVRQAVQTPAHFSGLETDKTRKQFIRAPTHPLDKRWNQSKQASMMLHCGMKL